MYPILMPLRPCKGLFLESGFRVHPASRELPPGIVRGGTSINNPNGASPLYIVDGVIRNDMNDLNSEDISSMQVLKDAASTSIYGARGVQWSRNHYH